MYNEERTVQRCVNEVISVIPDLKISSTLLVVNDGSSDNTGKILDEAKRKYKKNLLVITHKKNKGYGVALSTGISEAIKKGFEFCIFMDSDLTNDPKFIPRFIENISDDYDCIKASRYIEGGKMIGIPLYRQLISIIGNLIASKLFRVGVHDCTNGFRMIRLGLLRDVRFKESDFSIILEELYYLKMKGAKFKEIPNVLTSRIGAKSHFRYTPKMFWDYLKYALKAFFVFRNKGQINK